MIDYVSHELIKLPPLLVPSSTLKTFRRIKIRNARHHAVCRTLTPLPFSRLVHESFSNLLSKPFSASNGNLLDFMLIFGFNYCMNVENDFSLDQNWSSFFYLFFLVVVGL